MKNKKYLVIIGDVIKSREIMNREKFQEKFHAVIEKELKMIQVFKTDDVVSSFTITIGDEFQGVLNNARHLFKFIDDLEYDLNTPLTHGQPNKTSEQAKQSCTLRYGIGVGVITTRINKEAAIGMDGPAFYNARKAIEHAKKYNLKYCFEGASEKDDAINILLQWLSLESEKWNFRKSQIIKLFKEKDETGLTQEKIAANLRISQPAVSKILKNAPIALIMKSENLIENEINKILGKPAGFQYSMVAESE